jgi:hypothetical protein
MDDHCNLFETVEPALPHGMRELSGVYTRPTVSRIAKKQDMAKQDLNTHVAASRMAVRCRHQPQRRATTGDDHDTLRRY